MSRHSISIGAKVFRSKSEALAFYKSILGAYEIGAKVRSEDHNLLFDLKYADEIKSEMALYEKEYDEEHDGERLDAATLVQQIRADMQDYLYESGNHLIAISVDQHPEFKGTRCFTFSYKNDGMKYFSYILAINGPTSDNKRFSRTCRHIVSAQLREFKEQRFETRPVRCAITNQIVDWEGCQIDHKAPLTFSVIVKSFIAANKIDVSSVDYIGEITIETFSDKILAEKFREFHKEMSVLRVISTKQNQKLSGRARIKPTRNDHILA